MSVSYYFVSEIQIIQWRIEQAEWSGYTSNLDSRGARFESAGIPVTLAGIFRDSSQFHQANAWILPKINLRPLSYASDPIL